MEETEDLYYLQTLKADYRRRKQGNPQYSVRAYALNLGVDASNLSKILNDKILPTLETADLICRKLDLAPGVAKEFMTSIAEERSCVELYELNPGYTNCH